MVGRLAWSLEQDSLRYIVRRAKPKMSVYSELSLSTHMKIHQKEIMAPEKLQLQQWKVEKGVKV